MEQLDASAVKSLLERDSTHEEIAQCDTDLETPMADYPKEQMFYDYAFSRGDLEKSEFMLSIVTTILEADYPHAPLSKEHRAFMENTASRLKGRIEGNKFIMQRIDAIASLGGITTPWG